MDVKAVINRCIAATGIDSRSTGQTWPPKPKRDCKGTLMEAYVSTSRKNLTFSVEKTRSPKFDGLKIYDDLLYYIYRCLIWIKNFCNEIMDIKQKLIEIYANVSVALKWTKGITVKQKAMLREFSEILKNSIEEIDAYIAEKDIEEKEEIVECAKKIREHLINISEDGKKNLKEMTSELKKVRQELEQRKIDMNDKNNEVVKLFKKANSKLNEEVQLENECQAEISEALKLAELAIDVDKCDVQTADSRLDALENSLDAVSEKACRIPSYHGDSPLRLKKGTLPFELHARAFRGNYLDPLKESLLQHYGFEFGYEIKEGKGRYDYNSLWSLKKELTSRDFIEILKEQQEIYEDSEDSEDHEVVLFLNDRALGSDDILDADALQGKKILVDLNGDEYYKNADNKARTKMTVQNPTKNSANNTKEAETSGSKPKTSSIPGGNKETTKEKDADNKAITKMNVQNSTKNSANNTRKAETSGSKPKTSSIPGGNKESTKEKDADNKARTKMNVQNSTKNSANNTREAETSGSKPKTSSIPGDNKETAKKKDKVKYYYSIQPNGKGMGVLDSIEMPKTATVTDLINSALKKYFTVPNSVDPDLVQVKIGDEILSNHQWTLVSVKRRHRYDDTFWLGPVAKETHAAISTAAAGGGSIDTTLPSLKSNSTVPPGLLEYRYDIWFYNGEQKNQLNIYMKTGATVGDFIEAVLGEHNLVETVDIKSSLARFVTVYRNNQFLARDKVLSEACTDKTGNFDGSGLFVRVPDFPKMKNTSSSVGSLTKGDSKPLGLSGNNGKLKQTKRKKRRKPKKKINDSPA